MFTIIPYIRPYFPRKDLQGMAPEKMRRYEVRYFTVDNPSNEPWKIVVFATNTKDAIDQFWRHKIKEDSWGKPRPYTLRSIKKRYQIVSHDWMETE
jgi:hypothetical protein